jgi:hypothetical protein
MVPLPVSLRRLFLVLRFGLLLGFVWLIGRQWHPYWQFTSFLQIDGLMVKRAIPAVRSEPIFVHPDAGSYDGGYYAQIATDPGLRDPALRTAMDDFGYRARRILLSAVAWAAGGGDPLAAMRAYAWLNIVLWLGLAVLLWRVFPVDDWRGTAAWTGMLFGAGVLFSVRFALTDLAALLLIAGAVALVERGRPAMAAGLLAVAGLARETAVLGAAALVPWSREKLTETKIIPLLLRLATVVLPLGLWLLYVRDVVGGSGAGQRNLAWPLLGWWNRWSELWGSQEAMGNVRLQAESALEHVALTVQLIYLAWRPRRECPWWRVGATFGVLCLCLGGAVWGGFPNATSRVLLPLSLAFNVRAVRDRARWGWFLLGNLSVLAGFHAVQYPVGLAHELPAGSTWSSRHVLQTDARWSVAEWNSKYRWAWCNGEGKLTFLTWPRRPRATVELQLRGITPRTIEVRQAGAIVWRGPVGDRPQWITLPELPLADGRLELELRSDTPATAEGENNTARAISFACFGARLAE